MVNEFDNEIDAILRRARDAEVARDAGAHLEADAIAAFAENALPEKTRQRLTAHFADCARCRKHLSNVIALQAEAADRAPAVAVAAPGKTVETVAAPWYRRLFVFPQVAYTLGGLALVFSGFLGFLVLQNLNDGQSSAVSYQSEKGAPAAPDTGVFSSDAANTNTASAANANSAPSTTNSMPSAATNATTTTANTASNMTTTANSATAARSINPATAPTPSALGETMPTDGDRADVESNAVTTAPAPELPRPTIQAQDESKERGRTENEPSTADQLRKKAMKRDDPKLAAPSSAAGANAPADDKQKTSAAGEKRAVAGKTFNNVGGIWFDAAYNKQPARTVRRGSDDYRRLDAGLRAIADNLGGTVVVVWKGRAYRIE